jgi:hypothetical protein
MLVPFVAKVCVVLMGNSIAVNIQWLMMIVLDLATFMKTRMLAVLHIMATQTVAINAQIMLYAMPTQQRAYVLLVFMVMFLGLVLRAQDAPMLPGGVLGCLTKVQKQ